MDYPDPLLEDVTLDVPAGNAQPVWITVPVPATAAPGDWQAVARLIGRVDGAEAQVELNLTLRVFPAVVGRSRLWVTNWFVMHWPHMAISPLPDSQEYWDLLRRYARNMAAHRQNVVIISPLDLAKYTLGPDGDLDIDFARFDRWVQVFTEEGVIGRIEGAHLGGRSGNWESPFLISIREVKDGQVTARTVEPSAPEAERFYSRFLPALVKHLRERGWAGIYMQHLADEPIASNTASYRAMAELVHRHAPELRIIEACHTKDLVGAISVWVPQLNYLQRDYEHYRERQAAGEEVWFYTCIYPQGEYANRFIELPLLKTRLLHWINHRYGITGYLHWGYNYWRTESPFKQTIPPHDGTYLPAGDSWIVYPGREGPLDSIRFETMRDGIADYELLSLLADRDPDAAATLSRRHVIEFDRYDVDVRAFRDTRRELLRRLSQAPTR